MTQLPEVDFLLLGKTGNGKSSTGNSILRHKAFDSKSCATSVTIKVSAGVSEYNERQIKVVDGPGVGDTRMDDEAGTKLVIDAMQTAITMNDRGYHAFLLVVRYGDRFTKEDKEVVELLRATFGPTFIKNFGILLMTHGDNFENETEETGQTFEEWCKEQEGVLKDLMAECGNRVLLFNNVTKDEEKKSAQVDKLLQMVDNLQMQGVRYTNENFDNAKQNREKAMVQAKEPQIRQETMTETSLILQKLEEIKKLNEPQAQLEPLNQLKTRIDGLYESIKSKDKGTGALLALNETVESIRKTVYGETEACQRMIQEAERRRAEEQRHKEEMEALEKKRREEQEELRRKQEQERRELEAKLAQEEAERRRAEEQRNKESLEQKAKEELQRMERELKNVGKAAEHAVKKISKKFRF